MSEFMEINWGEGMFLRPHHLQQFSRYRRIALQREIAMSRPFAYGVQEINISTAELEGFVFSIRSCNIRLKDGTRIMAPHNGEFEPRDFKKELDAAAGVLDVCVGVPLLMEREPNTLTMSEESTLYHRRYKAMVVEVVDENTGANGQAIEMRKLSPRILFKGEDMAGYEVMQVARIERSGFEDNKPILSQNFIPSILVMEAWPPLFDYCKDIYQQLMAKNRSLISQIAGRKIAFGSEGVGGPEAMLKLNITNRYAAFLRQWTSMPNLHPFDVFVELCRLAGDLAIFDESRSVPDIPLYNHDDLGGSYLDLLRVLERLINNILPTTFIKRRFEPVENRREVALEDEWLLPEVEFYLCIESDQDDDKIDREVSFLKMGSVEDLPTLINRRLPGLMLRRIRRTPIGLPDRPNYHFYRISREGRFWDSLLETRVLSAYGLADETLELDLYILLRPEKEGE